MMGGITPDGASHYESHTCPWPYTKTGKPRQAYVKAVDRKLARIEREEAMAYRLLEAAFTLPASERLDVLS
jgi:hypothetical protein